MEGIFSIISSFGKSSVLISIEDGVEYEFIIAFEVILLVIELGNEGKIVDSNVNLYISEDIIFDSIYRVIELEDKIVEI